MCSLAFKNKRGCTSNLVQGDAITSCSSFPHVHFCFPLSLQDHNNIKLIFHYIYEISLSASNPMIDITDMIAEFNYIENPNQN